MKPSDPLALIRPINSTMVGFAVVVGIAVVSPDDVPSTVSVLGFLTGFSISGFSMVINDIYDVEVDRINRPQRPLAAGRISIRVAWREAIALLIIGLVAAAVTGVSTFALAAFFAWWAWLYNYKVKESGPPGNFMVALSVAIPYVYGGLSVSHVSDPLLLFLATTSFLAGLGREIIKTVADIPGDEVRKVRSAARVYGPRNAAIIGAGFFLSSVASSGFPLALRLVGIVYGLLVTVPIAIFLYASIRVLKDHSQRNATYVKNLALFGMITGLIAFVVGGAYKL